MPEGFYDAVADGGDANNGAGDEPPSPTRSVSSMYSFVSAREPPPRPPIDVASPSREQPSSPPRPTARVTPMPNLLLHPNDPRHMLQMQQQQQSSGSASTLFGDGNSRSGSQQQQQPTSVTRQGNSIRISFNQNQAANNSNNNANAGTTANAANAPSNQLAEALARRSAAFAASRSNSGVSTASDNAGHTVGGGGSNNNTNSNDAASTAAATLARRVSAAAAARRGDTSSSSSSSDGNVAEQLAAAGRTTGRRIVINSTNNSTAAPAAAGSTAGDAGAGVQQGIRIVRGPNGDAQIYIPQQQLGGGNNGQQQPGQQAAGATSQRVLVNNPHAAPVPGEGITIIRNQNGEQHVIQERGGRTSIRLQPGSRQIRIPAGAGNNVRIVGATAAQQGANGGNNNPHNIARVQIPPLVAQAIPTSARDLLSPDPDKEDDDTEAELDKYRCSICYEFFVGPSSCGKCASRFCHACLVRVTNTRQAGHQSKCPACRAPLTVDEIVLDKELQEQMKQAKLQVLCSYRGCKERLAAEEMKEHELTCPCTPMRCKNSTMGCPWHGLRKDVRHHLMAHCHVERVAGFVDQFRHARADHQHALVQLQRSQTMSNQMVEVNAGLMRRALPSPTNMFDLINLTYTTSCTTAYFLYTADIWRLFLIQQGAQESRAAVGNMLYLLPTVFNVIRTAIGGYRILLSLNVEQDLQFFADNMELGVLSMTPFFLLLTVGLCFLLDGSSSFKWSNYKYFGTWERTVLRDMATLALFVINIVIIETDDAGIGAVLFWLCVLCATCFFPPIVLTVLGAASGIPEPNPHQIFSAGRDASVVLFALRHAAIAGFLGFLPAIDAAIVGQLLRRNMMIVVRYDLVPVSDGIWSSIGSEFLTGFLGIRFSMWAIDTRFDEVPWITIIASIAYPLVNFLVHQLTLLGIKIGTLVFREGRANVLPSKLGVRNAFSVYGTVAFCLWSSMLMFLIAAF